MESLQHYQQYLPAWPQGAPTHIHMVQTVWVAVLLTVVRFIADKTLLPLIRKLLYRSGGEVSAAKAEQCWDNIYIVIWSLGTEVMAVYVTLHLNGGCTPWSTGTCLSGWPNHPLHEAQRWYMILMFQFYLHEMLGSFSGTGMHLKPDMQIHHIATMGLILSAYSMNLSRFGIMWQTLFDSSNPLLHCAKAMNAASLPCLDTPKWAIFALFALAFFVCRVAVAPFSIIWPGMTRSLEVLPASWAYFLIALMFIVCGMQWLWFYRIIKLLQGKDNEEGTNKPVKTVKSTKTQ
eukprot:CAMPEP_0119105168 /NCGR_PEP_ID=MMETSP1180-20130426/3206_1 /TAXON_ID=3052 ORGANISM="Chlamydomonas cf sp, Strain CCMP681" /NCGR_SAMPLE_ID=MMETSP1180 /ASSEMBLY_ACC=CAM_ASM_000741 /LENGTH=289 /DNA_ID=CAMNT_0007090159 /DNA_START=43 /DNA_END=912 /DNA_ORIENTATION=-